MHCSIDANIGYAGLAAYKNDKLAETDYVTLIDAGDAIQGEAIGTLSKGSYISDIMDFIGYDYACLLYTSGLPYSEIHGQRILPKQQNR